jgi:hypothetical protein
MFDNRLAKTNVPNLRVRRSLTESLKARALNSQRRVLASDRLEVALGRSRRLGLLDEQRQQRDDDQGDQNDRIPDAL